MKFNIYGRFQIEVRRENGAWVVYRSELGKRTRLNDVPVPPDLAAQEIATYLDDIFHEFAGPGDTVEPIPEKPSKLLFLPGALGRTEFWHPAAELLAYPAQKVHMTWPGFSGIPPDPAIRNVDDLATRVLAHIEAPSALIAQSMGGVVAMLAALRKPALVTHLVLSVTSGGMRMDDVDAQDWRPAVQAEHPGLPDWFISHQEDLAPKLATLRIPTLLLWGDADPISPVKAGQRLASVLPRAELHVIPGGGHDLACAFASQVAPLIDRHLASR
ncbi:alpha/beta fold hydrolase [Massilia sp. LXY-6]|uniref:alpha/beta fold hydrolase n=1 Tax=Massilia sp. LXY-6 TaxID=3379823 RepID=UPI003EDEB0C8